MRCFEIANKIQNGQVVGQWDIVSLPVYATKSAAGADFFAAEDIVIPSIWSRVMSSGLKDTTRYLSSELKAMFGEKNPLNIQEESQDEAKKAMQPTLVHTGVKACMEDDEVLYIFNRSSNPKKMGLVLANSVGVIDADYYNNPDNDGEIMFAYYNFFPFDVTIHKGDRIGQGVFQKFLRAENAVVQDVDRTSGFGSTGGTASDRVTPTSNGGVVLQKSDTVPHKVNLSKEPISEVQIDQPLKSEVVNETKNGVDDTPTDEAHSEYTGLNGLGAIQL